ncbi:LOW QUALITY PROTEIN: cilium assembly protein DZIP1L [Cariama cristata]
MHRQAEFWHCFLLQTGSDNLCPSSSELAEESPGQLSFPAPSRRLRRLSPGFPALMSRAAAVRVPEGLSLGESPTSSPKCEFGNAHFSADFCHPLHQPMLGAAGISGASQLTVPVDIPRFHFQPRQVSLDWHHFSTINVERVAWEVDVTTLQEHITSITFCNLDEERSHCRQPADPILLKVLRMAQLSIEYLLHCQEHLRTSLAMHDQHLQAACTELACTQQQAADQMAQFRVAKESKMWEKLNTGQQLVLQSGPNINCKRHLCDKAFLNDSFLQAHMQCQHAEATETERQKMKQAAQMKDEVEELKAKLWEMQQQLKAKREAEKLCREQETERARQRAEKVRDLEKWKEEEMKKLHEEVNDLRQLLLTAFKDMDSRISAVEGKLQELQVRKVVESSLGTLQGDDTKEAQSWAPSRAEPQGKRERMAGQLKKENKTLHAAPSQDQQTVTDHVNQQTDALSTHLGEQPKVMKSQEEKIKPLSASKLEVTQEVTKVVADEESSGRANATRVGRQILLKALWRNPDLLKQSHRIVKEVLEEKLESMGIKSAINGISTQTYKKLQALVRLEQKQKDEEFPNLLHLRDELDQAVMEKVKQYNMLSSALPQQVSVIPAQSPKSPRSLCGSHPVAIPAAVEPEALVIPQPAPQSPHSTHSTPRTPDTLQTSKASSPHRGLIPWWRDSHIHDHEGLGEMPGFSGTETAWQGETLPNCELGITQNQPVHRETPGISSKWPPGCDNSDLESSVSSLEDLIELPLMLRGPPPSSGARAARGHNVVTEKWQSSASSHWMVPQDQKKATTALQPPQGCF